MVNKNSYAHWSSAALLAVTLHGLAAYAISNQMSGAKASGVGGVTVNLGQAGGVTAKQDHLVMSAETSATPDTETLVKPAPAASQAQTSRDAPEIPVTKPQAVKSDFTERRDDTPAEPTTLPHVQTATAIKTVDNDIKLQTSAETTPNFAKTMAEAQRSTDDQASSTEVTPNQGATTADNRGGADNRGSAAADNAGGQPGEHPDYIAHLRAWLESYKSYPAAAKLRQQEGEVLVRFTLHSDGRLTNAQLITSSGFSVLDNAALQLLSEASPAPVPPAQLKTPLQLTLPLQYRKN